MGKSADARKRTFRHHPLIGIHAVGDETQKQITPSFTDFEVVTGTTPPVFGNTALVDQGGPKIDFADVRIIFWGNAWASDPNRSSVLNNIAAVIASPYETKLTQYGVKGVELDGRGPLFIASNPPNPFTEANVATFISGLIDDETLPEPDEDYRLVPVV